MPLLDWTEVLEDCEVLTEALVVVLREPVGSWYRPLVLEALWEPAGLSFPECDRPDLDESDCLRLYVRCCCGIENLVFSGEADIGGETRY